MTEERYPVGSTENTIQILNGNLEQLANDTAEAQKAIAEQNARIVRNGARAAEIQARIDAARIDALNN